MSRKRKPKVRNPVASDLPQNPEFQSFVRNVRAIMAVPKEDIDRALAEQRAIREPNSEDEIPQDC